MNYGSTKRLQFHLSEIFNLQHIIYSVSSEHSSSLACYINIIVFDWLTVYRQSPIQKIKTQHNIENNLPRFIWFSLVWTLWLHTLRFTEEVVLAQDGDKKADESLDGHGHQSTCHNVPLKWRLHLIKLTCRTRVCSLQGTKEHQNVPFLSLREKHRWTYLSWHSTH